MAARRVEALRPQIAELLRQGYRPWLITLTVRHSRDSSVDDLLTLLGRAWSRLTSGRAWAATKAAGVEYLRGFDQTYGAQHGWHPHIHAVFLFGPAVADPEAEARRLLARWIETIRRLGGDVLPEGLDAQPCADVDRAARYAANMAGVWETAAGVKKEGKVPGSRTVMDLAQAAARGDAAAIRLWSEYALATKGRRPLVCSRGLSLTDEGSEEAAETEVRQAPEEPVEIVAVIYPSALIRLDPDLAVVLEAAASSAAECHVVLVRILGPPAKGVWQPSGQTGLGRPSLERPEPGLDRPLS